MPILMRARAMPMVRMNRPMRCFWPAKTCSTAERTAERLALAMAMCSGSGRRGMRFCARCAFSASLPTGIVGQTHFKKAAMVSACPSRSIVQAVLAYTEDNPACCDFCSSFLDLICSQAVENSSRQSKLLLCPTFPDHRISRLDGPQSLRPFSPGCRVAGLCAIPPGPARTRARLWSRDRSGPFHRLRQNQARIR